MKKRKSMILATVLTLTLSFASMTAFAATLAGTCPECGDSCRTITVEDPQFVSGDEHIVYVYEYDVCNGCGHESGGLVDSYYESHSYSYNSGSGQWECVCGDSY